MPSRITAVVHSYFLCTRGPNQVIFGSGSWPRCGPSVVVERRKFLKDPPTAGCERGGIDSSMQVSWQLHDIDR